LFESFGLRKEITLFSFPFDVSKALNFYDEIIGQSYSDEVLDKIFNKFCIGK